MLHVPAGAELAPSVISAPGGRRCRSSGSSASSRRSSAARRWLAFVLGGPPQASWLGGSPSPRRRWRGLRRHARDRLNRTGFGKGILGACFVNDLGRSSCSADVRSVSPGEPSSSSRPCAVPSSPCPLVTPRLVDRYPNKTAAFARSGSSSAFRAWRLALWPQRGGAPRVHRRHGALDDPRRDALFMRWLRR